MQNKIKILCTRPVDNEAIDICNKNNIALDTISFISTAAIETVEVQQEIENTLSLSATVIFTSMNAVEVVASFMHGEQPVWNIYCIGNATKDRLQQQFSKSNIVGTANDAMALASLIVENESVSEVIFFCGDKRRDELPNFLNEAGIEVQEIVLYETIPLPQKVSKEYVGILFFSPSAVQSFFSVNKIPAATIVFAIGQTTAREVKKYCSNKIIISDEPAKQNLIEKMVEYFT